jgi:hypothetical protein
MSQSEKKHKISKVSQRKVKSLSNLKKQSSKKNKKSTNNKYIKSSIQHKQSGGMPYGIKDFSSSTKISPMPEPPCVIL